MPAFQLHGDFIELDKLLKAARLCGSGGEARRMIRDGLVTVDGETEHRLRRKIRCGMTVQLQHHCITVEQADG